MPHSTLKLIPGVDQNRTLALNEAAISTTNLVRFVPDRQGLGLVQKLGGWTRFFNNTIGSPVRALWAWQDTNAYTHLAVGCQCGTGNGLSVITNGSREVITPQKDTVSIDISVDTIDTTAGSSTVLINATGSNLESFDSVYIKTQISVGGLVLFGLYNVSFVDANSFNITARDALGNPVAATATVSGGAVPEFSFTASSAFISVKLDDHGYVAGDTFPILVPLSAGNVTLSGNYIVSSVTDADNFVIVSNNAPTTIPALTASGNGTTATVTFSGDLGFVVPVGSEITVAGVSVAGYNGTFTVTASSLTSVSYLNATVAAGTGGTVFVASAFLNDGEAEYTYYNSVGPVPTSTGYGVGGYGAGGFGTGVASTPGAGTPITAIDWTLDNWGEILIACPIGEEIYSWSPTEGAPTASIITNAPPVNDGVFVAMPQRQIIAWGSTQNGIQDPLLIRWCDVNNYNQWIPLLTNQAGSFRIPKGSKVVSCIQGPQQGLVWTDLGVWAMQYVGPPYIYQFNEIGTGCGLIGRKAATSMNGVVYWMGQSQFFKLSQGGVEIIPCPIWDVIFQDIDMSDAGKRKIRIAANSRFGEVSWFYATESNGGEINKYVKYNVVLNQWDYGTLSRTAWINESVLGPPIGAAGSTYIYQHETSPDADGQPMASSFQTGYFVMTDADIKMFVDQVWPDMKWGYFGGTQSANVKLTFFVTDYPGDTPIQYGPFTMTQNVEFLTPRFRGRLVSIKMESDDIGSFWRVGAMRYRLQPDGKF